MSAGRQDTSNAIGRRIIVLVALVVVLGPLARRVQGQGVSSRDRSDVDRAAMARLAHTEISVRFEDVEARSAIQELTRALGVIIIPPARPSPSGYDETTRVTLVAEHVTGLDALELLLDRIADYSPLTWQARNGMIEIGARSTLARRRVVRMYDVEDLLHDAPYFAAESPFNPNFLHSMFFRGRTKRPARRATYLDGGNPCERLRRMLQTDEYAVTSTLHPGANRMYVIAGNPCNPTPREELDQVMRLLAEMVEPGNWDWGNRGRRPDPEYARPDRIVRLRLHQRRVVVTAADYVHRMVSGMPSLPRPTVTPSGAFLNTAEGRTDPEAFPVTVHGPARQPSLLPSRTVLAELLAATNVTLAYDDVPARRVFADFAEKTQLPIVGRYLDERVGYGIDPERRITLAIGPINAVDALELILDACADDDEPCTWQIRLGFIEVGTKSRLSVPSAHELRRYDITDLMFEPAEFAGERKHPTEIGIELVETVVNTIEPGIWDYGQIGDDEPALTRWPRSAKRTTTKKTASPPAAARARSPRLVYHPPHAVGTIRLWRKQLLVLAPDYVHRQLGGYETHE